jgi:hypothetical protein
VLDGSKALSRAVRDVFDQPVIQRCQQHKIRNVRDRLPDKLPALVERRVRQACHAESALAAEAKRTALAAELDRTHCRASHRLGPGTRRSGRERRRVADPADRRLPVRASGKGASQGPCGHKQRRPEQRRIRSGRRELGLGRCGMTLRRVAPLAGALVVAAIAALASYSHMRGLAVRYGQPELIVNLLPVSVDRMMVVATVALGDGRRNRWSAWLAFWTALPPR